MDLAMIGLMRDGMLRVREASDLTWGALESLPDGTGRLRTGGGEDVTVRVLSADTMRLLNVIRHDAGDSERIIGLMPNQITLRIGAVAEHAGLGPGYSGESPRLGMLKDLDELGGCAAGRAAGEGWPLAETSPSPATAGFYQESGDPAGDATQGILACAGCCLALHSSPIGTMVHWALRLNFAERSSCETGGWILRQRWISTHLFGRRTFERTCWVVGVGSLIPNVKSPRRHMPSGTLCWVADRSGDLVAPCPERH